jgi:hypothetical protein
MQPGLQQPFPHWAIEKQDKLVHPYLVRHGVFVVAHHRDKDGNIQRQITDELFSAHGVARRNREKPKNPDGPIQVRCVGINAWENSNR